MMNNTNRLGDNIRALRKAYGETQEQLGEILHIEKNTVSSYENGIREPSRETIRAIAKHFMISIEDLLQGDYSSIGKIQFDQNVFWKNIDIILPIAYSEKAFKNPQFSKAYTAHKAFFDELRRLSPDKFENYSICMDEYLEAFEDDEIKAEAAANMIGLWYLLMLILKTSPAVIRDIPAAMKQLAKRDRSYQEMIENPDPSFQKEAEELLTELDEDETDERVWEYLTILKRSGEWSDLGDYYLALRYTWNLVNNGLDLGFNQRIGTEMLDAFASVNNKYAARFFKVSLKSINGKSSRSVDDRK